MIWLVLLQIVLIALNAVFAGTEIAVISVSETKLEKEIENGNKRARRLLKMKRNSSGFLATIQVAITLSGFLGAAFASDSFAEVLSGLLQKLGIGLSDSVLDTISVVLVTLVLSYFSIVFGEMVPKRIAMNNAERFSMTMSGPITVISKLFAPLVWLLTKSTNGMLRLCGIDPNSDEEIVTEEDLILMADAGRKKGTIDASENDMIKNVFAFDDLTVGEICTHRREVSVLWTDESIEEWEQTIHESRHSEFPVCSESIDQVVGVLKAKDFFRLKNRTMETVMEQAVHTPYFIHETMKADELFGKMKRHADHFAVVIDEYGGMCGIVTVTDLVEQLVGDFDDDETAHNEPEIERLDSKSWKISGACSLHNAAKALEHEFPEDEYETFGGYLIGMLGEIPKDGSELKMQIDGFEIQILNIHQHCVEKTIVHIACGQPQQENREPAVYNK